MKTDKKISIVSGQADEEHVLVLKKKKFPWWILIFLLLPLVLLIPISKSVNIQIVEQGSHLAVDNAATSFVYPFRGTFGGFEYKTLEGTTDNDGKITFDCGSQPLWVKLFVKGDSAMVSASNSCYKGNNIGDLYENFSSITYKLVELPPIAATVTIRVVDDDDLQPLPDAEVQIITTVNGNNQSFSTTTDVGGNFDIENVPQCGQVFVKASRDGYQSDSLTATLFDLCNMNDDEKVLHLKPLKGSVKVVVRNLKTKTLLPGAMVTLTINGQSTTLKTNTNGVGVGCFDSLRISNTLSFAASKTSYADTVLNAGTVKDFMTLPEDKRTMYLRPLTESLVFINTDGSNPLSGVKNAIKVNGSLKATEYSNSNGEFTVVGVMQTDKISITASKTGYTTNSSKVANKVVSSLTSQDSRTIPLSEIPKPTPTPTPPVNNKTTDLQGQSGDLRINLQWYSKTDLDLHVIDPCSNEIYFSKRSATCNGGRGTLDVDANAIIGTTNRPQENIYWLKPSNGTYTVKIVCFKFRDREGQTLNYNLSIVDKNGRKDYPGSIKKGQTIIAVKHTVNN